MKPTFSIKIISLDGSESYLSVRGKTEWKTYSIAANHALEFFKQGSSKEVSVEQTKK